MLEGLPGGGWWVAWNSTKQSVPPWLLTQFTSLLSSPLPTPHPPPPLPKPKLSYEFPLPRFPHFLHSPYPNPYPSNFHVPVPYSCPTPFDSATKTTQTKFNFFSFPWIHETKSDIWIPKWEVVGNVLMKWEVFLSPCLYPDESVQIHDHASIFHLVKRNLNASVFLSDTTINKRTKSGLVIMTKENFLLSIHHYAKIWRHFTRPKRKVMPTICFNSVLTFSW